MNAKMLDKINGFSSLIGNTPILEINFTYKGEPRVLYAKAEHLNMTGSIKDRMAFHIIKKAYENGKLKEGYRIIEATSGNTGISFSAIGKAMGHPVTIFMPDWMSSERKNIIKSLGAEVKLVTKEQGGFLGSIKMAEELAASSTETFLPRQFSNSDNTNAHILTTGPEIYWQLRTRGVVPTAFVAGVGTGGTIMGVGGFLKQNFPKIKLYPLEPSNSPTMSTGHKVGKHRIQGISDEFIPPIINLKELDSVVSVDDGDSILMAQKLAHTLGLGVGISSGANFLGAIMVQEQLGNDAKVITIFSDDNKKYLSTDLLREEPIKPEFISNDVVLKGFRAIKRVCYTCCDPKECASCSTVPANELDALPICPRRK